MQEEVKATKGGKGLSVGSGKAGALALSGRNN